MSNVAGLCSKIVQAVVIVILFVLFFQFFGLSTFQKWNQKDVQTVRRKEASESLLPPAITICAFTETFQGWQPCSPEGQGLGKCKDYTDLEECVNNNTFSLEEVLNGSARMEIFEEEKYVVKSTEAINNSLWTSRMTATNNAMCHTLNSDKQISKGSHLRISLNYNFSAYLHDPKFFVFKETSVFVPFLELFDVFHKDFIILATRKKRMRRKAKFDCNPDESYNYGDCVRQKIVEKQGCVTPWDQRTTDKLPKCTNRSSMEAFESYYNQVHHSGEDKLLKLTGCLLPCTYTHYSLQDSFSYISNETDFKITYALTDLITEEEVLLFPVDSLVSEFGGALGLFLGFSFLGAVSMMRTWAAAAIISISKTDQQGVQPQTS